MTLTAARRATNRTSGPMPPLPRLPSLSMLLLPLLLCHLLASGNGGGALARTETTSLPAHQRNFPQEFSSPAHAHEFGNPVQGADNQRAQPLSVRAVPVSSRGALAFLPRASADLGGPAAAAAALLPSKLSAPSELGAPLPSHANTNSHNNNNNNHILSQADWCAGNARSQQPSGRQQRGPAPRSASEVLAVEGTSIKLNLLISAHRVLAPSAQPPQSPQQQQQPAPVRLRLHWQRDNQPIGDLNLARGRFSSVQLASESEPEALRRALLPRAPPASLARRLPQGGGGGGNASEGWQPFWRTKGVNTKDSATSVNDENNEDRNNLEDDLTGQLDKLALFGHLLSLGGPDAATTNLESVAGQRDAARSGRHGQSAGEDQQQQPQQQQSLIPPDGFALYPFVSAHQLETLQPAATLSSHGGGGGGAQISPQARQAISLALNRISQQQQEPGGSSGANVNTNGGRARGVHRSWQPTRDNFLADGQAIDWPTLGLYLAAHNLLSGVEPPLASAKGRPGAPESEPTQARPPGGSCRLEQLDQLIAIQLEISQLRVQDRGQYQLYVCQQPLVASGAGALGDGAARLPECLQSQLVASISLQVIEDVPRLESWFEPQLLSAGERLSIKCEATGFTLPQISWYLDGQLLSEHQQSQAAGGRLAGPMATGAAAAGSQLTAGGGVGGGGGSLLFPLEVDSDQGQLDELLQLDGASIGASQNGRKQNQQQQQQLVVVGLRSRETRLHGSHTAAASNQFFRIGDYVSQDNHVHSFVNSSALRLADAGHYKCQANNGLHVVEHEARVDVRGPVAIERALAYNASALIGPNSKWTVQCPYGGYPLGAIEWYFRPEVNSRTTHAGQHQHQRQDQEHQEQQQQQQQQLALDYQDAPGGRLVRAARRKRRPAGRARASLGAGLQDGASLGEELANADDQDEGREYLLSAADGDPSEPDADPDRDEWLSQASAMTAAPGTGSQSSTNGGGGGGATSDDYPEPLPDYPVPVAQGGASGGATSPGAGDELAASYEPDARSLASDEFELTEAEDLEARDQSRLSPDYGDIEMSYQQEPRQKAHRLSTRSTELAQADDWVKLPQSRRHQVHPNGTLAVHDIQQADQGLYKCRALGPGARQAHQTQAGGQAQQQLLQQFEELPNTWSNELYLSVLIPPVISPFSSSESLREGMRNFLTCSVIEGDSPVRLAWLKDGQPIEEHMARLEAQSPTPPPQAQQQQQHRAPGNGSLLAPFSKRIKVETNNEFTSTLSFSHVDYRDNGNYTCIATNKAASVNYTAKMVVNVPPKWTRNPKDVECVAGQNIVIDCQAEAHPSPRIWWEIGVVSPQSAHQVHATDKHLELSPAAPTAELNKHLGGQSLAALASGPRASARELAAGHDNLAAHQQPPNHYRTIISNSRIHILENASLVIRDVGRRDQGYYLCQAANNFGSLSALIRLTVNVGASFSSKYLMKYVRLNERVELDCDPAGQAPVTVTWFVRQQPQQHAQSQAGANQLDVGGGGPALVAGLNQSLSNYHRNHHHHHRHHVQAPGGAALGEPPSPQQQQQQSAPMAADAAGPSALASGLRRRLFAGAIQTELPASQQQLQAGNARDASNNNLSPHQRPDGEDPRTSDEPASAFGAPTAAAPAPAGAQHKLIEIDSSMSFEILKLRNQPATQAPLAGAYAHAHASGQPEFVRLHIKQARRAHSGEYICQAANEFGADEKLIKLLVQEAPDSVQELSVLRVESRSVSVAWAAPFAGNSPITSYTVEWAPLTGAAVAAAPSDESQTSGQQQQQQLQPQSALLKWSQVVVQQPVASLGPLQPTTSYEIRVRAHNQFGSSPAASAAGPHAPPAAPFVVTTTEEAPGAPPSDIRAHALSSSSVQVSWLPPGASQGAAQAPPSGAEPTSAKPAPSQTTGGGGSIKGYYLGYRPANSNDSFIFRTVAALPLPLAPMPTMTMTTTMTLTTQPGASGRQDSTATTPGARATAGEPQDARRVRVVVGDLRRNTEYHFVVQASNSAGSGPRSDPVEVRTLLNDPPPAPLLRAGLITYATLELQWSFHQAEPTPAPLLELDPDALLLPGAQRRSLNTGASDGAPESPLESIKRAPLFPGTGSAGGGDSPSEPQQQQQQQQQQQRPLVDGYHLYFRRAGSGPPGEVAAQNWHERRLTHETHSIIVSQSGATGDGANGPQQQQQQQQEPIATPRAATSAAAAAAAHDLTIVETSSKFAESKQTGGGWLRFHGPNATLSHRTFRYMLDQLACGTPYQVYLVAYNSYGASLPSQIVRAKTRGSAPVAPRRQQDFVQANSTLVQLSLAAWSDGGCSLSNFEIRYKQLRGGRPEAIELLREGPPVAQQPQQPQRQLNALASAKSWLLLSNSISPEQRSIELRDLRPETWYALWVSAESAAGKTDAQFAFMTLDKLGQVPSEALEPLPVSLDRAEGQLPALFRSGAGGASGAIRSILYNLSGGPNGPGGAPVSPLVLSACLMLVIFATCSLLLIKRYNNLAKDGHSIDLSSSRATTASSSGAGSNGSASKLHAPEQRTALDSPFGSGLDHYSLDTKLNGHGCDALDHAHGHHQHQHQHQHHNLHYGDSRSPPLLQQHQQQLYGQAGDSSSIVSSSGRDQSQHYSMKLSPCKSGGSGGGGGATVITNSSSSTNGSSGAFLLAGSGSGGGGGSSSICDALAYGPTPNQHRHQQQHFQHHLHHNQDLAESPIEQAAQAPLELLGGQFVGAGGACRHARALDDQQVQFCLQSNCGHEQLGKFATLARGAHDLGVENNTNGGGGGGGCQPPAAATLGHAGQRNSATFRTLPHPSLRPVSTFLPPTSHVALQSASGCQMANGTLESLNRFYGATTTNGAGAGNPQLSTAQQQNLADQQQIYSKLRLLHQQYQAATAAGGGYNLGGVCQQQPMQLQDSSVGPTTSHEANHLLALNQVYASRSSSASGGGLTSGGDPQLGALASIAEAANQQQQQQQPAGSASEQAQQQLASSAQAQQPSASGTEQDNYALPFPPKWV